MTNSSPSRIKKEGFQFSQLQISKRAYFIALSEFRATWNIIYLIAFISFLQDLFVNIDIAFQYIATDISDITSSARFLNDLFNFHNLFSYNPPSTALLTVCSLIILYFGIVLGSFLGVIYGTLKQKPPEYFLSKVWSYLIQVHAAVLFLPISNICAHLQSEYRDRNLQFSGTSDINGFIFCLSIVINIINILFAALPYTFLLTVLPSKNPLASKSIVSDRQIFYHKLIISLTCLLLPDVPFTPWFIVILNFAFSALRFTWFFYTLPRYSFQMLRFELLWTKLSGFISAMTCFIFIANQAGASFTVVSVITGAVVILPVLMILNYSSCQWILRKILFASLKALNPYIALHKVLMLKYLQREMKAQNERQFNFDKHYFYLSAMNTCPEKIFEISLSPDQKIDLSKKSVRHNLKRMFLETIVEHFRSSNLLKLILARFYASNLKLYPLAIKTLSAIKSQSSNIRASVDLLHVKIQNEVLERSKGQQQKQLSIYEYIIISHQQEQFKDQIRKQVTLQQDFWKEYSKNEPGIVRLQTLAQSINKQKLKVSKTWTRLEQKFPKSLNRLYLIYSQYHYVCNDSLPKAREYVTKHYLYAERETRVTNQPRSIDFKSSDKNTFSVTIRTDLKTLGNIAHCSRSIQSVLGYNSNILIGSNLQTLMTPFVAERHNQFLQDYLKTGKSVFLGQTQSVFVKNEAGFLEKAYLNVNMHPFINQELFLTGLFQTFQDHHEYILVAPDGKIDSYTLGIASSLGLSNNRLSISSVCPDLDLEIPSDGDKTDFGFGSGPFNIAECITEDREQTGEKDRSSFRKPLFKRSFSYSQKKTGQKAEEPKNRANEFPKKQNLVFRHSLWSHNKSIPRHTFEYECNISLNPVQNEFLYIIEINPFDLRGENLEVASQNLDQVRPPAEKQFSENLRDYELEEEVERNNELDQDEKRGGWLKADIQHLNTPTENAFTTPSDVRINLLNFTENNPMLTFKTEAVTSARPILAKEKFLSEEHEEPTTQRRIQFERKKHNSLTNKSKSEISSSEAERRIQSCIHEGLKTMYFPKIILKLIGLCVFTIPGLLVDQLYLGISASNNLHTIKSLTETLDLATTAVNAFARLDLQVRAAATVKIGLINPSSTLGSSLYGGLYSAITNLVPPLKSTYGSLSGQIQEIDEVFQENFRRSDIKMYNIDSELELNSTNSGNFTYQEFDMFTAMTLLVDRCYRLRAQYTKSSTYSVEDLYYVLANSANDLFERVVSTVTDILQSTQNSIAVTLKNLTWIQIICCALLLIIAIIVYYHVYKVYQDEIRLMQQFVKISPPAISQLQNKIDTLAKMLEDSPSNSARYFKLESDHSETDNQNNSSAKIVKVHKTPDVKELKRNYLKKFFVFLVNLVCFCSIFSLMSWLTISHIGTFKQKVNRLYTTQTLVYQVSTLSFSLAQLTSNDTESRIMNMPVGEIIELQLQNILVGVNGLFSVFQNGDGTIDPRFSAILSGNACDYVSSTSKTICANIVKGATNIGLISMLARVHSSASLSYQAFASSNQSAIDVQTMITSYYTDVGLQIYVVRDLLTTMVNQARNDFYETWDQAGSRITLIICLDLLLLSISGSVSIFYCFLEVLLYFNKFKAVLKVVPTQILIKNSALKGLLIMSSNGKLDPIKNEI